MAMQTDAQGVDGGAVSSDMPAWPEQAEYHPNAFERFDVDYERARAEAAIARLRKAVEALQITSQALREYIQAEQMGQQWYTNGRLGMIRHLSTWREKGIQASDEAIAAIGEIPN